MFTNGVARYLRRVNLGDYQHAEASAEISWSAVDYPPGEAVLMANQAAALAKRQVEQQLGIAKPAVAGGEAAANPTPVSTLAPSMSSAEAKAAPDPAAPDVTPTTDPAGTLDHYLTSVTPTPPQNDKAALAASMTNGGSGEIVTSKGGVPVSQLRAAFGTGRKPKSATQVVEADPADMGPANPPAAPAPMQISSSPAPTPEPSTVGPNLMSSSEPTPVEIWQGTPAAKTYTVAELGRACSEASLRLKAAGDQAPSVTIMDLVGKFGKATNAIPEDKRAEFLAELALLEPRK